MKLLILSTWFPYPLSKGCKIRAYHLIKALAQDFRITLIAFADEEVHPSAIAHMKQFCQRIEIIHHDPFRQLLIKKWLGWFSQRPSAVASSFSQEMDRRTQEVVASWKPDLVLAFTFVTAPYALNIQSSLKIVDVDNLMSPMLYESYQQAGSAFARFRCALAWRKFQKYERWLYRQFDLCLMVSERDRRVVQELNSIDPDHLSVVPNGVDTITNYPDIVDTEPGSLVFNGALTYQNNFDAMNFFLRDIFPLIRKQVPGARLRITGPTCGVPVETLPKDDGVIFTGFLEDIRPTVARSWVCVVPLRKGGGTRLKILEAMALGTPVVSTSKAAEGLDVLPNKHLLIADLPKEFAEQTVRLLSEPDLRNFLSANARSLVKEKYDWTRIGNEFRTLISLNASKQEV